MCWCTSGLRTPYCGSDECKRIDQLNGGHWSKIPNSVVSAPQTPPKAESTAPIGIFVGMPAALKLDLFASLVNNTFGGYHVYLVGSATRSKQWRDVDVVYIMGDDEFQTLFGKERSPGTNAKWQAMCMAYAALAKEMTGLPVDFKIQQMTTANKQNDGPRMALGLAYRIGHGTEPCSAQSPGAVSSGTDANGDAGGAA